MLQVTYETLAGLPLVQSYEEAFFRATGATLKLVPSGPLPQVHSLGPRQNEFCRLASDVRQLAEACWLSEAKLQRRMSESLAPQTVRCFAGLQVVAAPVVVEGRHVATWIGGQVLSRTPGEADFGAIAGMLDQAGLNGRLEKIKAAFLSSQVVSDSRLGAMKELVTLFAQHVGDYAERLWLQPSSSEPRCVTQARAFLEAHSTEEITLGQVAAAVHVSPYHFCRVFRTATGVTFTEYVSRLRVQRAKALLADPAMRVSEIAYATGFGSISQFNSVFRKHLGRSPSEYRESRKAGLQPGVARSGLAMASTAVRATG